jgi:RimJ/RimL family protein N-acetyltransferase
MQLKVMAELNNQKIMFGIVNLKLDGTICGVISIQDINFINGTAELGIMLDKNSEKFPEIFADSVSLIIHHAFTELRLRKISIGSINANLIKVFEKLFNFSAEGILKDHVFKKSEYKDVYLAAVFSDTMKFCHEES